MWISASDEKELNRVDATRNDDGTIGIRTFAVYKFGYPREFEGCAEDVFDYDFREDAKELDFCVRERLDPSLKKIVDTVFNSYEVPIGVCFPRNYVVSSQGDVKLVQQQVQDIIEHDRTEIQAVLDDIAVDHQKDGFFNGLTIIPFDAETTANHIALVVDAVLGGASHADNSLELMTDDARRRYERKSHAEEREIEEKEKWMRTLKRAFDTPEEDRTEDQQVLAEYYLLEKHKEDLRMKHREKSEENKSR